MEHDHEHHHGPENKTPWWKTPVGLTAIFFFVVGGYFLLNEHRAHIGSNWIWLILMVCPLMHLFMHGGDGGHRGDSGHNGHYYSDDEEES